ncbi:MAG: formylglycine-generating enzyme family protein [Deltaproteobacteria bacterium]|nr:formylglycine-generating enzyme family protein [Deltaproteobacteria bacterium]
MEPIETDEYNIHIKGNGFVTNDDDSSPYIQGSWYWYSNPNSDIVRITATVEDGDDLAMQTWFSVDAENKDSNGAKYQNADVQKICISGKLSEDENLSPYVGIGFDVCSIDHGEYIRFPFTVGTCPSGHGYLKNQFMGVSFNVEFPNGFDDSTKFIVQFKERGLNLDARQPSCYVKKNMLSGDRENNDIYPFCLIDDAADTEELEESEKKNDDAISIHVRAWHGDTYIDTRDLAIAEGDTEIVGRRNRSAVQGIHFQIEPIDDGDDKSEKEKDFTFCLSNIRALVSQNTLDGVLVVPPYVSRNGGTDSEQYSGDTQCLNNDEKILVELVHDKTDSDESPLDSDTDIWKDATLVKSDTDDDCELASYPEVDGKRRPFWVMKEETSAAQFYSWIYKSTMRTMDETATTETIRSEIEARIRTWDSCSVYRYHRLVWELKKSGAVDVQELEKWGTKAANCINWEDARGFCEWIGGKLPTKEQWEYAAGSGCNDRAEMYPWNDGNEVPNCSKIIYYDQGPGCGKGDLPLAGCTTTDGNTQTGVCDMIGNLWEWTTSPYQNSDWEWVQHDYYLIKGGGYDTPYRRVQDTLFGDKWTLTIGSSTSFEHRVEPHNPNHLGFRCIMEKDPDDVCGQIPDKYDDENDDDDKE